MLNIIKPDDYSHLIAKVKKSLLLIARAKVTGKPEKIITDTCRQLGTGFFIDSGGTVLTNMHVLNSFDEPLTKDERIVAIHYDSDRMGYRYTIIDSHLNRFREIDIAFIELNYKTNNWLSFYDGPLQQGEPLGILGYPVNDRDGKIKNLDELEYLTDYCTTVLSSIRKQDFISDKGLIRLIGKWIIKIDMYLKNGFSGSPVFRLSDGKVLGVVVGTKIVPETVLYSKVYDYKREKYTLKPFPFYISYTSALSIEEINPFYKSIGAVSNPAIIPKRRDPFYSN